jgi:hypothetical protein
MDPVPRIRTPQFRIQDASLFKEPAGSRFYLDIFLSIDKNMFQIHLDPRDNFFTDPHGPNPQHCCAANFLALLNLLKRKV